MFLGHFAVAFAAKRAVPKVSLGTLFGAAQLADLVWPVLVLAGVEKLAITPGLTAVNPLDFVHYPYSHSLTALALWALAFAAAYRMARGGGALTATVLAALVLSHWFLDALVHRPDLPVAFDESTRVGLGLWNSVAASVAVEGILFALGVALYLRGTRSRDGVGRWALVALVVFFAAVYAASVFGPPPPGPDAVAASALAMGLLVAWAAWIDRHRSAA